MYSVSSNTRLYLNVIEMFSKQSQKFMTTVFLITILFTLYSVDIKSMTISKMFLFIIEEAATTWR